MNVANRFKITRRKDHFILAFSMSTSDDAADEGEAVTTFVLPLTTAVDLCLDLFGGMISSIFDLNVHFTAIQERVNNLNSLSSTLQEKVKQAAKQQGKEGGE